MRKYMGALVALGCLGLAGCSTAGSGFDGLRSQLQDPVPPAEVGVPLRLTALSAAEVAPRPRVPVVQLEQYGRDSIVINTRGYKLYYTDAGGTVHSYDVGVGKAGFEWSGEAYVKSKQEWPAWNPPKEMIAREHSRGRFIPTHMEGGPGNPLGARALYLFDAKNRNKDTYYRIHGTNDPKSIGKAMSSGCIRLLNRDITDLYRRVNPGKTKVVVL